MVGFKKQWENMIDKTRLLTSLIFLGALIMTLISALVIKSGWLVLLFLIINVRLHLVRGQLHPLRERLHAVLPFKNLLFLLKLN